MFDAKIDFTRKDRLVLDAYETPMPEGSTYAGIASREKVRILFTHAALNGTEEFAADIVNVHLEDLSSEIRYILRGLYFGL